MHMPKLIDAVRKMDSLLQRDVPVAEEFLGLQEACSNMWQAVTTKKNKRDQERRLASILIAVKLIAEKLNIDSSDNIIDRRLRELARNKHSYKQGRF